MTDCPANAPHASAPTAPNPFQPLTFLLPAGDLEFSPAARHHIMMHSGAPVATRRSLDGKTQDRMQLAGDFDVVPCGMAGRWRNEGEIELLLIEVDQRFAESVSGGDARTGGLRPGLKLRDPHLHQLTMALSADSAGLAGAGRIYYESVLTAIIVRLMFLQNGAGEGDNGKRSQMALRQQRWLIDYIESNLSEDLSLTALAAQTGLGLSRFKTLFRNSLGCTPHAYIVQRRLHHARQLIQSSNLPLSQIALEAGFSHQSHMSNAFKRFLGVSPAELRKQSA